MNDRIQELRTARYQWPNLHGERSLWADENPEDAEELDWLETESAKPHATDPASIFATRETDAQADRDADTVCIR